MAQDAGGTLSSVGAGAAAGTAIAPGYGTAAGAALGLIASLLSNNDAAEQQSALARDNLQNSQNQQAYLKALNAVALQRSTAGTVDGQGSQTVYDPATNTWRTTLGPQAQSVQNASNNASIARDTTDLRASEGANNNATLRALMAQREAGPALSAVRNFNPMSTNQLAGLLQSRATDANRHAQDPIIADTLRQFARTGTAAGPVLTQMQRDNSDTLRRTVTEDTINAMTKGADINNANRAGLMSTYQGLNSAANPSLNFSPISTQNPSDILSQEVSNRANTAGSSPFTGGYPSAIAGNVGNTASENAIKAVPNSNLLATQIASLGKQAPQLLQGGKDIWAALTSGDNNNGDTAALNQTAHFDPQSNAF